MPASMMPEMMTTQPITPSDVNILHILRAPVGGLFRHVQDLAAEQAKRGYHVGIICDSLTGGEFAVARLAKLAPLMVLGIERLPMPRQPSIKDILAVRRVMSRTQGLGRNGRTLILHGHGAKGGVYARLPGLWSHGALRAYTAHGGSFNYRPGTAIHAFYMRIEAALNRATDIYLYESAYIKSRIEAELGPARKLGKVAVNGISEAEFEPVTLRPDAADFLYLGELRAAKGIDTLIEAMSMVHKTTVLRPSLVLAGTGPDEAALKKQVGMLGLGPFVSFIGAQRARHAMTRAHTFVVPSRAESLPYSLLEATGAGMPTIATNVGGIPEIFGPFATQLIACNDASQLAARLISAISTPPSERAGMALAIKNYVRTRFTIKHMVDDILEAYGQALRQKLLQGSDPVAKV